MDLVLSEEQLDMQEIFRDLFTTHCSTEVVRSYQQRPEAEVIGGLWGALAATGFFGLALPEDVGGQGTDLVTLGLGFEEAGRALCPTLVYSTTVFGVLVDRLGSAPIREAWLPRISDGSLTATVAVANPADGSDVTPRVTATRNGDGWCLTGTLEFVANGGIAEELLVSATTGDDTVGLFIVPREAAGVRTEPLRTLARDPQSWVILDNVAVTDPVRVLTGPDEQGLTRENLAWASNTATALQTMEMTGGIQAIIDRTVDYLKTREQFGRPLAGFQAVQHHVANMVIGVEGTRLAALQACHVTGADRVGEWEVAVAKLKAGETYTTTSLDAHQLHGGMGFMREFDLHLWSERAKSTEVIGGAAEVQLDRIARVLELAGGHDD